MHVSHASHMHEPGTDARIWTCDVWWAARIGAAHICNIVWCICLSNSKPRSQPSCATPRAISPKGNGRATKPATSAAGPPIPATRVTAISVQEAPTSRPQDGMDSRCNTTTNRSRPKRWVTVPAGKTDPMGARVMYSVKAPAGDEYRMCLKELETPCKPSDPFSDQVLRGGIKRNLASPGIAPHRDAQTKAQRRQCPCIHTCSYKRVKGRSHSCSYNHGMANSISSKQQYT